MRKLILALILLLSPMISIMPQVISSEKVSIRINNLDDATEQPPIDNKTPEIILISPSLSDGDSIGSDKQKLYLIGRISEPEDIASVYINAMSAKLSPDGLFNEEYLLKDGMNEICVMAVDKSNNLSRLTFHVDYTLRFRSARELGVIGQYYALIIGIDQYSAPEIDNLINPVQDARKIYQVLTEEYTFEKENVKLLENPKRNDIINALDEYSNVITPNDNLMIFYAGHGFWDQDAKIGYWLPSDAVMRSKTAWFRNSTLQDYLREINSRHTLLVSDACFSGSIFKTRSVSDDAPMAIKKLYELPSRKAMTSGTLSEVPDESAFVKYLIQRLVENQEKYLPSEQLFSSFRIAVSNNSIALPQFGEIRDVGDEGGDFIFIRRDLEGTKK
jgi:hypothetical protein